MKECLLPLYSKSTRRLHIPRHLEVINNLLDIEESDDEDDLSYLTHKLNLKESKECKEMVICYNYNKTWR